MFASLILALLLSCDCCGQPPALPAVAPLSPLGQFVADTWPTVKIESAYLYGDCYAFANTYSQIAIDIDNGKYPDSAAGIKRAIKDTEKGIKNQTYNWAEWNKGFFVPLKTKLSTMNSRAGDFDSIADMSKAWREIAAGLRTSPRIRAIADNSDDWPLCPLVEPAEIDGQKVVGNPNCKWGKSPVYVQETFVLPASPQSPTIAMPFREMVWWWITEYEGCCGIDLNPTASGTADIVFGVGDHRAGVGCAAGLALARSGYPCQQPVIGIVYAPCRVWGDWTTPPKWSTHQARKVAHSTLGHELGHAVGLYHCPDNVKAVMNINGTVSQLQPWDIAELQRRYGPPKPGKQRPPLPAWWNEKATDYAPQIRAAYKLLLNRDADSGGIAHWNGVAKRTGLCSAVAGIATSGEFLKRCRSTWPDVQDEHQLLVRGWYLWMDGKQPNEIGHANFLHWLRRVNGLGRAGAAEEFCRATGLGGRL